MYRSSDSDAQDPASMTIEILRARLLAERAVSKTTRAKLNGLADKVAELEEELKVVYLQRKKAEQATADVLAILEENGFNETTFDAYDSDSDHDCYSRTNSVSGKSLSWKGRRREQGSSQKIKDSCNRRHRGFRSAYFSSSRHRQGRSCRQIRRSESRDVLRNMILKVKWYQAQLQGYSFRETRSIANQADFRESFETSSRGSPDISVTSPDECCKSCGSKSIDHGASPSEGNEKHISESPKIESSPSTPVSYMNTYSLPIEPAFGSKSSLPGSMLEFPVGCAGLFRVPTEFSPDASTRNNFLASSSQKALVRDIPLLPGDQLITNTSTKNLLNTGFQSQLLDTNPLLSMEDRPLTTPYIGGPKLWAGFTADGGQTSRLCKGTPSVSDIAISSGTSCFEGNQVSSTSFDLDRKISTYTPPMTPTRSLYPDSVLRSSEMHSTPYYTHTVGLPPY